MLRFPKKRNILFVGICCLIAGIMVSRAGLAGEAVTQQTAYKDGMRYYENNETDKAIKCFKDALAAAFPDVAGKAQEDEKVLLSQLDDEKTAALANYQLGLIYEAQGKIDESAMMFRNALTVIANKGASYVGVKTCRKCHLKQYKSWKVTKMAKTFEPLKPGVSSEAKVKLKLDPQKDYTKEAKCLECHTTGFGLPGGYKVPEPGDSKAAKRAKENKGTTCEGCHGPGSKYIAIHKKAMTKKRKYTLDELYQVGQHKVDIKSCTTCHNRRNPTAGADYHFDYKKYKAKDAHKNFPLKYRTN